MSRITLKNFKHAAFMSEETNAFRASVYFDGELIGTAENDGHGGSTFVRPFPKTDAQVQAAHEWAATLPQRELKHGGETLLFKPSLDSVIDDIVEAMLTLKAIRASYQRTIKQRVLYTQPAKPGVFQSPTAKSCGVPMPRLIAVMRTKVPAGSVILNDLPLEQAVETYATAMQAA